MCAIGEEENGQEGTEFTLFSVNDGVQLYITVDSYGDFVSLDGAEGFDSPSASLLTFPGDFIALDGKQVSGEMVVIEEETSQEYAGSFAGTCP